MLAGWTGRNDEVLTVVLVDVLLLLLLLKERLAVLVQGEGRRSPDPLLRSHTLQACRRSRRRRLGVGSLAVAVGGGQGGGVPPRLHFPVLRRRVDDGTVWGDWDAVLAVEVQAVVGTAPLVGVVGWWVGGVVEGGAEGVDVRIRHRGGGRWRVDWDAVW